MIVKDRDDRWARYFMRMAKVVSEMSKDPSTKIGAVLVGSGGEVRSTGFNGMPMGVDDNVPERTADRDTKLLFFEHAERNAIFLAARHGTPTAGCTMYICGERGGLPPCSECARAMIQAGVRAVVITSTEVPERWKFTCGPALDMLSEAGVELFKFTGDLD